MISGAFKNQLDDKNRMIVPAKFRSELGNKCVLSIGLDDCVILYPASTWDRQKEELDRLSMYDKEARALRRFIYSNAWDVDMDKQGRIVFPEELREKVHIDRELMTIGISDRVEIWSREVYERSMNGGLMTSERFEGFDKDHRE